MELLMKVNFYAWIGIAVSTAVLIPLYWISLESWRLVWRRITSIYSMTVVQYWLQRLEKEGLATFERAKRDLSKDA